LEKIKIGLTTKYRTKRADKINQRIGRAIQKYPSVSKYYNIEVKTDQYGRANEINWYKDPGKYEKILENLGVYFIRTNLSVDREEILWKIYNTIREIEYSFRTLKTDPIAIGLDLRPIYHKSDKATMAHLHLGLLGYWLVNTVRHQLKKQNISHCWGEIIRIGNTQKIVSTFGKNQEGTTIQVRRCSEPNPQISELYKALNYKPFPFVKKKSVVHNSELKKNNFLTLPQSPP
jgi:hypothetical protein